MDFPFLGAEDEMERKTAFRGYLLRCAERRSNKKTVTVRVVFILGISLWWVKTPYQ